MLNSKRIIILLLTASSTLATHSVTAGEMSVDQGMVFEQPDAQSQPKVTAKLASRPASSTQAMLSTETRPYPDNYTPPASNSINGGSEPAIDGRNIQPVPAAIASPVPLTKEVIPSRLEYIVAPGVNTLVPISINQINRLVTPFEHPVVQKVKQEGVTVNVKDNALYVSTSDSNPASLYISEKGDESVAISVSLVPQKIAPVQATLMLSRKLNNTSTSGVMPAAYNNYGGSEVKARRWEQKDNYIETIRNIMRTIALGDIPPGYSLGNLSSGVGIPNCNFRTATDQDQIRYSFANGQYLQGSQFSVIIGVAQNTGSSTVMVDESLCTHPQLAARALWSRNTLQPGQRTEAYFVIRNIQPNEQANDSMRPKLAE
ncbi:TraK domain-containing protein [Citrobacter freundii]|uniref:TraK domain-containing protein n=1 Tax=Citrobacter freundii TaxID=546 RepID=UPI001F455452|nr:type-F conjugative transfer system secretin TraK [Citrobacter freundii]